MRTEYVLIPSRLLFKSKLIPLQGCCHPQLFPFLSKRGHVELASLDSHLVKGENLLKLAIGEIDTTIVAIHCGLSTWVDANCGAFFLRRR